MIMKNIAIVAGGYSSEYEVSLRSAEGIRSFIDGTRYNVFIVIIRKANWVVLLQDFTTSGEKEIEIDKNDFSFTVGGDKTKFDFAYITIHGTPGEDGLIQGYFDMLGIPYSSCGVLAGALTFNKFVNNQFLKTQGIKVADSVRIKGMPDNMDFILDLGLPVFVKPNAGGSSFGVSKVKEASQLQSAITKALNESDEVIIEAFVKGTEVTCGCYKSCSKEVVFPITEVVTENEFFDYDAKYNGQVQEITPARISAKLTEWIRSTTANIYDIIGARGIIRIDYIIPDDGGTPVLLEINTNPGMTSTSFIPQQIKAAGLDIKEVMTEIIENKYAK